MSNDAAWQEFIATTPGGVGGDVAQPVVAEQLALLDSSTQGPAELWPMLQIDFVEPGTMALFVPSALPDRDRVMAGLARLDWITLIGGLHYFPTEYLQKIIFYTQNYPLRWGIIGE